MPVKIFIGCLADGTTSNDLLPLFKKYGPVVECDVLSTYGFVHMESMSEARQAIEALDGLNLRGSTIHVELSTNSTQGRKKQFDIRDGGRRGGRQFSIRHEPYPPPPPPSAENDFPRYSRPIPIPAAPLPPIQAQREEYASEQVKDLLELYFRDPYAFDQYAKTYYYGERYERVMLSSSRAPDKRFEGGDSYLSSNKREDGYGHYSMRTEEGFTRRVERARP